MRTRFVLYGISGVYNYGCEAIVRGTVEILRRTFRNPWIVYLSHNYENDRVALADCPIRLKRYGHTPLWHPRRLLRSAIRRSSLPYEWIEKDRPFRFRASDWLLSIGGDIFTLGPGPYPSDVNFGPMKVPLLCARHGGSSVLWGASIGPFEAWPQSVSVFRSFLERMTLITVREDVTLDYLRKLGITENVVRVVDPAFVMRPETVSGDFPFTKEEGPVVGVNLSPLSVRHAIRGQEEETIVAQAQFLGKLIRLLHVKILLIPHTDTVVRPNDDDHRYLEAIRAVVPVKERAEVRIIPRGLGARRTKAVVALCSVLLAARMHCAIAGVSTSTPTLFIHYSPKALGMAQYVYGGLEWTCPVTDLCKSETVDLVGQMLSSREGISQQLSTRRDTWVKEACEGGTRLAEAIRRHNQRGVAKGD